MTIPCKVKEMDYLKLVSRPRILGQNIRKPHLPSFSIPTDFNDGSSGLVFKIQKGRNAMKE